MSDLSLENEFCVDYSVVKDEFIKWLYNQVNEKTANDYIRYLDKYVYGVVIKSQDDLEAILDRIKGGYNHFVKAFRNLLKFLEKKKLINKIFANELKEILKVKKSGIDTFVPSDELIRIWLSKIDREVYEIVFKLLAFSGLRFNEVIYLLNTFTPKKLHFEGKVAYYDLGWDRNTKKSFKAFMPAEFAKKLRRLNIHPDAVVSYFKRREITPKHLRKWNATKLLKLRVPESIVDFIQGRASGTVLAQHYLAKLNLAIQFYGEAVDELVKIVSP